VTATETKPTVDFEAVKTKQQVNWSAGNYAVIGTGLQLVGESLCEAVDLVAGSAVLDIAAGNGNASLAAARRHARVTAVDYVPELLAQLDARAAAEGLSIDTVVGDGEALDVADGSFDTVLSTFGIMFAPNQERAASELVRACRPGGRIGMANWKPDGFVGDMFRTIGKYVPPPAGIRSPMEWGKEERLHELFGGGVSTLTATERTFVFRYPSAAAFVDEFRTYYGPMTKAFEALDDDGRAGLAADLEALAEEQNTGDGWLRVPSTYLEVVAQRA
jgi:SAM-dependent methyltransferase